MYNSYLKYRNINSVKLQVVIFKIKMLFELSILRKKNTLWKNVILMILSSLMRIREVGLQSRETNRIYTKKPICEGHGKNFGSVRLTDCIFVVLILVYGIVVSLFAFLLEKIAYKKICQKCRNSN